MPPTHSEGKVPFAVPGTSLTTETYYRVYGELSSATHPPLVALHGGPGMCSDYTWLLGALFSSHGIPVITYDQIGNGRSTHLPERNGDADFWTEELFMAELDNLLAALLGRSPSLSDRQSSFSSQSGYSAQSATSSPTATSHPSSQVRFSLLGHSWGGMLAARYATRRPHGLHRLVVSNSPAHMDAWVAAAERLRSLLPPDVEATLRRHEKDGSTDSDEYEAAVVEFYKRHFCRVFPFPEEVQASLDWVKRDGTTYNTMNGPSEFYVVGSLRNWNIEPELHNIEVPALILNGSHDEAQDECVKPYVDLIPDARWHRFEGASHMSLNEQPDAYLRVVGDFLAGKS